ncbi:MAG: hypothetical protein P8X96_18890 [Desulfobacteraceae bacterium]|jgi:hypothetical protein
MTLHLTQGPIGPRSGELVVMQSGGIMFLKVISFIIWSFSVISVILYFPMAIYSFNHSKLNSSISEMNIIFIVALSIFSIIQISLTLVIRYFALIRPAIRSTFRINTTGGGIRFFLVNFLNWALAESVAVYGMVLYFMYGKILFLLVFGFVGFGALIFHVPRYKPFQTYEKSA